VGVREKWEEEDVAEDVARVEMRVVRFFFLNRALIEP
jgi:hypothetical protein